MAPQKMSKMKQVCTASPSKFAAALLDILDGSVEDLPVIAPVEKPTKGESMKKRPAAAMASDEEGTPTKKAKTTYLKAKTTKTVKVAKAKNGKGQLVEQSVAAQRRKELKTMSLAKIKGIVVRKGLDLGSKEKMIELVIAEEAKSRANIQRNKSNVRDVVIQKRQEFTGKTNNQLKDLLQAYDLQTGGTKPQRVERLLSTWKEQGEIEKVLAGLAFKARKAELKGMDKNTLYQLCLKKGVDALSKDVLVDRLLVHESVEIWQEVVEARRQMGGA